MDPRGISRPVRRSTSPFRRSRRPPCRIGEMEDASAEERSFLTPCIAYSLPMLTHHAAHPSEKAVVYFPA